MNFNDFHFYNLDLQSVTLAVFKTDGMGESNFRGIYANNITSETPGVFMELSTD